MRAMRRLLVWGTTSGSKGGRVREGKPEVKEGPERHLRRTKGQLTPHGARITSGALTPFFILATVRERAGPGLEPWWTVGSTWQREASQQKMSGESEAGREGAAASLR